jgi:gliding motility-associated lipoprotein GldH
MRKRIEINLFVLILSSFLMVSSCKSNVEFTGFAEVPGKTWKLTYIPEFNFQISDTLSSNNIWFMIRTGSSYPYRNIYLFVTALTPDGKTISDTLQYYLADEKGNWYGSGGVGDIHSLNLPYKSNIYFPLKGTYKLRVQHGMRIEDLPGVYDLGLRVEKIRK